MLQWFMENAGTIIVSLGLIALVAAIIVSLLNDRKQGRSSCGKGCSCCPMAASCRRRH